MLHHKLLFVKQNKTKPLPRVKLHNQSKYCTFNTGTEAIARERIALTSLSLGSEGSKKGLTKFTKTSGYPKPHYPFGAFDSWRIHAEAVENQPPFIFT